MRFRPTISTATLWATWGATESGLGLTRTGVGLISWPAGVGGLADGGVEIKGEAMTCGEGIACGGAEGFVSRVFGLGAKVATGPSIVVFGCCPRADTPLRRTMGVSNAAQAIAFLERIVLFKLFWIPK